MDKVARYNITRWNALVQANALFTQPYLNLDVETARTRVDPEGRLGKLGGKEVLCLAGGGGQQSAAFALLGANVTVFDLAQGQLQRDQEAATHYQVQICTIQGDMRDLSALADDRFDLVWQPYSLNFVPEVAQVFRQVARVLRPAGLYQFNCANPFVAGLGPTDWNGEGYVLKTPYQAGAELTYPDQAWVHSSSTPIPPPREFRHTLSALVNGLLAAGFVLEHLSDITDFYPDPQAEPGTWDHFTAYAPPWLNFWARYHPQG
jgi:ubiquinone/menaquinone biosynthesis C-methylase UbiE